MKKKKFAEISAFLILICAFTACTNSNSYQAKSSFTMETNQYEVGNSNGNYSNGGYFAVKDGWVYYCPKMEIFNNTEDVGLYKMEIDGSNKTKLCVNNATNISVVNSWV